jgi:hypothetical protein
MTDIQNVFVTWGHALRLLASMEAAELLRPKNQQHPSVFIRRNGWRLTQHPSLSSP